MNIEKTASHDFKSVNWKPRLTVQSQLSNVFGDAFACLIPMLTFVEVEIVGRLFLPEILLLLMFPFLLIFRGHLLLAPLPKKLILLGFIWLLSQIATDMIRDTPIEDASRGVSKIIFLLLNFSSIYLYINGKKNRLFMFALGIALGQILMYFINPNIYAENYPWKFGYGSGVTLLIVLAAQFRFFSRRKLLSAIIILSAGLLNFYTDFRSLGLICALTGGFIIITKSVNFGYHTIKPADIAKLILFGGIAIYAITAFYSYSVNDDWFGEEVREKYLLQSTGDMGLLLGGRAEILASSQAIIDSPIIGHGSWAKDPKYVDTMLYALSQHGYALQGALNDDLIPTHSYIMGAWVEAGLAGAIFWFFALMLTLRGLTVCYQTNAAYTPLVSFIAFNLLWNIPFSPFGAEGRLFSAYDLSLMIVTLSMTRYLATSKLPA